MKNQKGITLIALIITIIVMLILVGVSVSIALNTGLFKTTQGAAKNTQKAADAEQKLAEGKIKIGDNWYASYQDYLDGIVLETGIVLDEKAVLEVEEGYNAETTPKVTKEITISLNGIEGEITLENTDNTVATIDKEKAQSGDKITITALKVGTTTITAKCGDETATCEVTVKVPVPLAIGAFIQYDVEYTDAYEGYEYTKDNGWRLLSFTDNGNGTYSDVKLISTGIPARLVFGPFSGGDESWYVKNTEALKDFINILKDGMENGDTYFSSYDADGDLPGAAGLYYNFGEIEFGPGVHFNLGNFTSIKTGGTTYNSETDYTSKPTGHDLFIPAGTTATVRLLTLTEISRILGRTVLSYDTLEDPAGAPGLFKLRGVYNVIPGFAYDTPNIDCCYLLATPRSWAIGRQRIRKRSCMFLR